MAVGAGPQLAELRRNYPRVQFPGVRHGAALADLYAAADVFVFPSLTDTFGLVMLEAIASGTPVAAFPVTGPLDVLQPGITGIMDPDVDRAIVQALTLDRTACRRAAGQFGWPRISAELLQALAPASAAKTTAVNEAQWENPAIPA